MDCSQQDLNVLHGDAINLQRMTASDVKPIVSIMQDPDIITWWGLHDEQTVTDQLLNQDLVMVFTIRKGSASDNGEIIGSVQAFEEPSHEFRHAGMDLFIAKPMRKQGYGADTILTMAKFLMYDRGHHRLVVQPSADNKAAIEAWKAVGFKEAGYLRQYQRCHDGTWKDAVLLEAIRGDIAI